MLLVTAMLSVSLSSCGDDDDPDSGKPVDPTASVNDPEGTISLSMRNYDNGETYLDDIYIRNENFKGAYFASIGAVRGLGNVSTIPTTGWAQQMSVVAGNGYVAFGNNQFYRIYVVGDIIGTTGGVIGSDIKYQKPFKGVDEAIQLPESEINLTADGGYTDDIIFKNKNIIVYSAESDQNWCQVRKCSSHDFFFLYNGISVYCYENPASDSREATITLTTAYDKKVTVKVIQAGQAPFISAKSNSLELTSKEQTSTIQFTTNIDISDIQITGTTSWCQAEISTTRNVKGKARFIGENVVGRRPVASSTSYYLSVKVAENASEDERTANLTIKSSKSNVQENIAITQKGGTLSASQSLVLFDKANSNATITINSAVSSWTPKSSASWCTFSINGNRLTIRATASTTDRQAKITFEGFKQEIIVHQSKYAVGDEYSEGKISGTVGYIGSGAENDDYRLIFNHVGKAIWSTENVSTGATDEYDGRNNMAIIKKISGWKDLYPAFALCESLNINGVTGWYLPASIELHHIYNKYNALGNNNKWSSTEYANYEYAYVYTSWNTHTNKNNECEVYAVYRY